MTNKSSLAAGERAAKLLRDSFIVLDTETTGFSFTNDEIIQIAAINERGDTVLNTLIKPRKPITNSQYHGLTDDTVRDAPTFAEFHPQLQAALDGQIVLVYNFRYDSGMIAGNCQMHKLSQPAYTGACIMELYSQFYGEQNRRYGGYKWQKLNKAVADFGLQFDGKEHDALADCKAALAVLKKMAEWYEASR